MKTSEWVAKAELAKRHKSFITKTAYGKLYTRFLRSDELGFFWYGLDVASKRYKTLSGACKRAVQSRFECHIDSTDLF